jgi:WXG100 family type VII secretion target
MSGPIGATPETLQELSDEIQQGAAAIQMLLGELERKVRPLTADWQGTASQSFEVLWEQWQAGAEHVHDALVAISELLAKAGLAYAEADRSIAAAFEL